jgi:hypothetical protein
LFFCIYLYVIDNWFLFHRVASGIWHFWLFVAPGFFQNENIAVASTVKITGVVLCQKEASTALTSVREGEPEEIGGGATLRFGPEAKAASSEK